MLCKNIHIPQSPTKLLLKISANIFFIKTAYLTSLKLKAVINLETFTSKAVVNFINKKNPPPHK